MTWQRQCRKAGAELGGAAGSPWPQPQPVVLPASPHTPCAAPHRAPETTTQQWPQWLGKEGRKKPHLFFSFCYFISLQWEQLRMLRINENNCWATVQVVNKEPQTLLSPTTKRCWHKKNSIFLCRNHLLNSLVLNRIPCLLPLFFPPEFKNKSHKNIIFLPYMPY